MDGKIFLLEPFHSSELCCYRESFNAYFESFSFRAFPFFAFLLPLTTQLAIVGSFNVLLLFNFLYPQEPFIMIFSLSRFRCNYKLTKQAVPSVFLMALAFSVAHFFYLWWESDICWFYFSTLIQLCTLCSWKMPQEGSICQRWDRSSFMTARSQHQRLNEVKMCFRLLQLAVEIELCGSQQTCFFTTMMMGTENYFLLPQTLLIGGYFSSSFPHHTAFVRFCLYFFSGLQMTCSVEKQFFNSDGKMFFSLQISKRWKFKKPSWKHKKCLWDEVEQQLKRMENFKSLESKKDRLAQ